MFWVFMIVSAIEYSILRIVKSTLAHEENIIRLKYGYPPIKAISKLL
ncbi:MAG: hypothetical protein LBU32_07885 [Clostridiales bacterium]|jgi:hypothetical protein|nr:hypothetical protein [Clostridiales bacterium]